MTTTQPHQLGSQSSPQHQMSNPPAESGSSQRDLELLQLVQAIKNSPDRKDRVTRKQIDRFLREVLDCLKQAERKLIKDWQGIVDIESIVAQATNNTLLEAVKNIDRYDPNQGDVMQWIKGILNFRFLDLLRKYRERYKSESIDNPDLMVEAKIQDKTEDDNAGVSELETVSMASELLQFIKTDPDGHLSNVHIRNRPDATLQKILLMRLQPLTWQEIADRLDISRHTTVSSFHNRQLEDLNHYFRKHLY